MAPVTLLLLTAVILATSVVSGIFGMAGGMILMGVLLAVLTLPQAMALHAITQIASNGWRGLLWIKYVRWRSAGWFLSGCALAFAGWSAWRYVPSTGVTLLLLGIAPFLVRLLPEGVKPDPDRRLDCMVVGAGSMALMLLSGVSGPLIDTFFLGGRFDRRQIVATKAVCQITCHTAKLAYFGAIVDQAATLDYGLIAAAVAATIVGNSLAKPVLERLSESQYRTWANRIVLAIATVYLAQGLLQTFRA